MDNKQTSAYVDGGCDPHFAQGTKKYLKNVNNIDYNYNLLLSATDSLLPVPGIPHLWQVVPLVHRHFRQVTLPHTHTPHDADFIFNNTATHRPHAADFHLQQCCHTHTTWRWLQSSTTLPHTHTSHAAVHQFQQPARSHCHTYTCHMMLTSNFNNATTHTAHAANHKFQQPC